MNKQRLAILFLSAMLLASLTFSGVAWSTDYRQMPACHEDESIQGAGDYYSDGRWDTYECGPAWDDLSE